MVLAASMMVMGALPAFADDRPMATDRPVRQVEVRAGADTDRAVEPEVERPTDRPSASSVDRPVDRNRCVDVVNDRRCVDDRHPHVNLRHLIQRLIDAGEWEKLFRLLHRLGII